MEQRSLGGTCRPLDSYDFKDWPINEEDIEPYLNKSCEILEIPKSFGEKNISDRLKIIEFQESNVRFHEKYFEYIKIKINRYLFKLLNF